MRILFVHLLNNFSGSPKVLSMEIRELKKKTDYDISILTSKTEGILSNLKDVTLINNGYQWTEKKLKLIFLFFIAQIRCFFFVLFHSYDVVYINTVVPFGAALAAKLRRERIIYHVHEVYLNPGFLKRLYYKVMKKCADRIICVSRYVKENFSHIKQPCTVIYNPIEKHEITEDVNNYLRKKFDNKIIFMPTGLKEYKGIRQFVEIARLNKQYSFVLLCSVSLEVINDYFKEEQIPSNLTFVGKQPDLWEYYKRSAITVNLTLPKECIETFGLTLVEGFDACTPAIAPNMGGPKEIVSNNENGFLVDPYKVTEISASISTILQDFETYKTYALNARESISKFDKTSFIENVITQIYEVLK